MCKKALAYFKSHPVYNGAIHLIAGVGVGILVTYPLVGSHPIRWGVVLLVVGIAGHLYPVISGK